MIEALSTLNCFLSSVRSLVDLNWVLETLITSDCAFKALWSTSVVLTRAI